MLEVSLQMFLEVNLCFLSSNPEIILCLCLTNKSFRLQTDKTDIQFLTWRLNVVEIFRYERTYICEFTSEMFHNSSETYRSGFTGV